MSPLTQKHRAQQLLLRRATVAQLTRLWPALDWKRLDATYPDFALQAAALVNRNRETSAALAADYLRAFRRAQGIPGEVRPVFAEPLIVDQFQATIHSTSVASAKAAASSATPAEAAMANALTLTKGAAARLVLDAGRADHHANRGPRGREVAASSGWRRLRVLPNARRSRRCVRR